MTRQSPDRPRPAAARRGDGFTLLELVVVMGVIAMLLGLGIGFLRTGSTVRGQTLSALRAEFRRAAVTARSRSLPTEVVLKASADDLATIRGRVLEPVAVWHLEPAERSLPVFRAALNGTSVPGRFGRAMTPAADEVASLFSLPASGPAFDLSDGFAFRLDIKLSQARACTLLRLGRSLTLELSPGLRPRVRMVQRGDDGGRGVVATLEADSAVPLRTWFTIELVHDGVALSLGLDGRSIGRRPAPNGLYQRSDDVLEISPGDAHVPGAVDEIQLLAYAWGELVTLPLEAELMAPAKIAFDRRGNVQGRAAFEFRFEEGEAPESFTVGSGGVVE